MWETFGASIVLVGKPLVRTKDIKLFKQEAEATLLCKPKMATLFLLVGTSMDSLHGTSNSRPDMSFDTSASSGYVFGLGRASLAKASSSLGILFTFLYFIIAKKDMDVYTFRLTQTDLNDLVIKYNIPRDLHPRLPSHDFVTSGLPDDAIGIYHRVFDFSGVRIPFSTFILSVIIEYKILIDD
uniref:Uncharacterized protein n=1 Tax=Tanacetum cinerariifolium TaxID=118510 RepID=A0A6L2M9W4_TANCI|nr:hypothetical protein [Tanacetum cinerariifolium]